MPEITKKYFGVMEVARRVGVDKKTILKWEAEFSINPDRVEYDRIGRKTRKRYTETEILLLQRAKNYLKDHRKLVKWAIHQKEVIIVYD